MKDDKLKTEGEADEFGGAENVGALLLRPSDGPNHTLPQKRGF